MAATESQYAIETVSLTKIFPDWWGRAKVVAVEDLNLNIRYNEIYGFLGPNGSGKTTTIKMLLNLLRSSRANPASVTNIYWNVSEPINSNIIQGHVMRQIMC